MATAAIIAGVLFACDRIYQRHFLRYWVWSWLALIVSLAFSALALFGRSYFPTAEPWRTLVGALGISAGYLRLVWILFGNREMAKGERLPRTITRWVPITVGAATLAVVAFADPQSTLGVRLAIRSGVKAIGYLGGAVAVVAYGGKVRGGLGRRLMAAALIGLGLQQAYFTLGAGLLTGGLAFQVAHSGVVDLALQLLLSVAMVLWLLEGEREHVIVLSRAREEAERARADAARFTGEIVSSAAQAIVALDRRLVIEVWNPFAENLFEIRAADALGKDARDVFPRPNDEVLVLIRRALGGETVFLSGLRSNLGRKPWCSITFCPRRDSAGETTGVIALISDITESRQAEEARAAQVRLTSEIVNGVAQAVVAFDRDFKIALWNPYAERLTGWKAEEMLGMGLPEAYRRARPPDCEDRIATALRGQPRSEEFPAAFPGNPWISTLFTPLRAADGELTGAVLLVTDVTERKQAEAERARLESALLAAASDWKATFDAVDVLVVVLDSEGRVARLNRAAMELSGVGYARSLGAPLLEVAKGEPWATGAALAARLHQAGARVAEIARDHGTGKVWGLSVTRFSNPEGGEERVVIVGRDLTPVVRLEESLRRKENMSVMGSLVAGVAHEVRNPLFGISSTVDAFEARFGDVEKHQRYLSTLRTQVDRLRQLMSDLLEYGKPLTSEPRPESVAEVVGEAVRSCELLARRGEVRVQDTIPADLPRVGMDRSRMVQVFQNVVQNAIEFAGRGGRVFLAARAIGDGDRARVEISVRDTGPGFQEADIPRLFEPFFTRRRGGTGLGLSIVQRIVEQTGGRVTAANHSEGGAMVTIELPAGDPPQTEVGLVRAAL